MQGSDCRARWVALSWMLLIHCSFTGVARAEKDKDAQSGNDPTLRFQCLAEAYPTWVKRLAVDPRPGPRSARATVELADGSALPWDDGVKQKTADQLLDAPDLKDMLSNPYPVREGLSPPGAGDDPGRARVALFFEGLYGRTAAAVEQNLDSVPWPSVGGGGHLKFNRKGGAADALRLVSAELERLPSPLRKYFTTTSGTFNARKIAGTERPSAHSWGIAIDLNTDYSDYWRWDEKKHPSLPWKNRIPVEIVRVFERRGFIWGGRWHHYDTMHFEYRPEMLRPACVRGSH